MKETIEALKKATLEANEGARARIVIATNEQLEEGVLKLESKLKESMSDFLREITKELRAQIYAEIEFRRSIGR
jgi:predicted DNA-binding antitoxin AbrB/MazE fold protein